MGTDLQTANMSGETITHDRDQLRVDLILVFLVVLRDIVSTAHTPQSSKAGTYSFELVKLDKHDRLLLAEMPPEGLAYIRDEFKNNR